jgi:predicted ABC-type ATPase
MVADVNDDIEAEPTLRDDRFVQSVEKDRHKGFEVRTFTPRTQTNPR